MEKDIQKKLSSDEADISVHDGHLQYAASPRPAALQHLSEDELKQLETRLRRKTDIRLLPSMILIYIMNYLDRYDTMPLARLKVCSYSFFRNAIGAARLGGLEDDLGLKGDEFQVRKLQLYQICIDANYCRRRCPSCLWDMS